MDPNEHGENQYNDPTIPPFAKVLTWKDISKRVEARNYWHYKQQQDRGNARYHHFVAPLYGEIGDAKNEIKHHRLACNYNSSNANARNDFGLALLRQGKLDRAEKEIAEALLINPDHGLALNNMAAVLARKGKFSKAQSYCEKAIQLNPNDAMAHRNLAKILDTLGNTRDAVKHNQIAIQLGPGKHGVTHHPDTMTFRNLARQLVARGQTVEGKATAHYDQYRALAYKKNVLPNSQKTVELLQRTKTKA